MMFKQRGHKNAIPAFSSLLFSRLDPGGNGNLSCNPDFCVHLNHKGETSLSHVPYLCPGMFKLTHTDGNNGAFILVGAPGTLWSYLPSILVFLPQLPRQNFLFLEAFTHQDQQHTVSQRSPN